MASVVVAVVVDVVAVVLVTRDLVIRARAVAVKAVGSSWSWTTMSSLPFELLAPALAALTKVNVKCLSHYKRASRCE